MAVTKTTSKSGVSSSHSGYERIRFHLVSNTAGVASDVFDLTGQIMGAITIPTIGATQPDAAWDFKLLDPGTYTTSDVDFLNGGCLDMVKSDIEFHEPVFGTYTPTVVSGQTRVKASGMGSVNTADVLVFLKT